MCAMFCTMTSLKDAIEMMNAMCGDGPNARFKNKKKMAMGNSHSNPPVRKIQFLFYKFGDGIKVVPTEWVETQLAFGQVKRQELTSQKQYEEMQQLLEVLGGQKK